MEIIVILILTAFTGLTIWILYMLFFPFLILSVSKFDVNSTIVRKGDFAEISMDFEKYYGFNSTVKWQLVDGIVINLNPESEGIIKPVGKASITKKLYIPDTKSIPVGKYRIRLEILYEVFPLRNPILYSFETNEFLIME